MTDKAASATDAVAFVQDALDDSRYAGRVHSGKARPMQLRYTIFYVENVEETLGFYERAFGLEREILVEGGDYGALATGSTRLAFSSVSLMRSLGKTPGQADPLAPVFEIAFETHDVAGALERARQAGATVHQEPRDEPWGQMTAYVADPNGYLIEICTPVGPQAA